MKLQSFYYVGKNQNYEKKNHSSDDKDIDRSNISSTCNITALDKGLEIPNFTYVDLTNPRLWPK